MPVLKLSRHTVYVLRKKMLPYWQSAASAVQCKSTGSLLDKSNSQKLVNCQHDKQWGYENFRIVNEVK